MKNQTVNFKNKNNRSKLYKRTFMKNNLESRIVTLQDAATKLTLYSGQFAYNMNNLENYKNFSEAIGDIETMIEVAKQSIEPLQETSRNSKYKKLQTLQERTDNPPIKETSQEEKPKETAAKIKDSIPQNKSFFNKLIFWK